MTEKFTRWDAADDLKSEEDIARSRGVNECVPEINPVVLDELNRRAVFRDIHPNQGKSLEAIAQSLGVKL